MDKYTRHKTTQQTLAAVGDGRPYYNKLQEKSYVITPEKTAFV